MSLRGVEDLRPSIGLRVVFLCCFVLLAFARPSVAQELEESGKEFLSQLQRAGWSGEAKAASISATIRNAPLCSWGMLNAVRAGDVLTKENKENLADVARVTIGEPGWFFGAAVEPGEYRLGFVDERKSVHWVLRNDKGKVIGKQSLVIYDASSAPAQLSVRAQGSSGVVLVRCGNIKFSFRFLSERGHRVLTKGLKKSVGKRVTVFSDRMSSDFIRTLKTQLDIAVDVQSEIYGGSISRKDFTLYLFPNQSSYREADRLLTGGTFADAGSFASRLTDRAYCSVPLKPNKKRDGALGYPMMALSTFIHEINHLVAQHLRPGAVGYWADWFAEGLTELGVELALEKMRPGDGKRFYRQNLGEAWFYRSAGTLPTVEDLAAGEMAASRQAFYVMSYLVCRQLYHAGAIPKLLDANDKVAATRHSEAQLREQLERSSGSLRLTYEGVLASIRDEGASPATVHGYLDHLDSGTRVTATRDSDARAILPDRVSAADRFEFSADFSYLPGPTNQVDLYFGYQPGRYATQFYKVALVPKSIQLWRFLHGNWKKVGHVNYKSALAIGKATAPHWHHVTLRYLRKNKKLRVELKGGRWAAFELEEYFPLLASRVGFGTWGSAAWFRSAKLGATPK